MKLVKCVCRTIKNQTMLLWMPIVIFFKQKIECLNHQNIFKLKMIVNLPFLCAIVASHLQCCWTTLDLQWFHEWLLCVFKIGIWWQLVGTMFFTACTLAESHCSLIFDVTDQLHLKITKRSFYFDCLHLNFWQKEMADLRLYSTLWQQTHHWCSCLCQWAPAACPGFLCFPFRPVGA